MLLTTLCWSFLLSSVEFRAPLLDEGFHKVGEEPRRGRTRFGLSHRRTRSRPITFRRTRRSPCFQTLFTCARSLQMPWLRLDCHLGALLGRLNGAKVEGLLHCFIGMIRLPSSPV
ncbi:hypothetical protein H4582DRAFT_545869 [Lactarius indigo]|nr:hypothetical protein H4582DRAFT_545869 [Lactarius indigo]